MNIHVDTESNSSPANLLFEIVERKGAGHPDTLCDAIAETASRYYSRYCLQNFGKVAHHWFDKVMLVGGESNIQYGAGQLLKPYRVIFAGKCAFAIGNKAVPVRELIWKAAEDVLTSTLTEFHASDHLEVVLEIVDHQGPARPNRRYRPRSVDDLVSANDQLTSNDSTLCAAFSPLSMLERMVLFTEHYLNGAQFKASNVDTGWDVKVIGYRHKEEFHIIANMPFLARQIPSFDVYITRRNQVHADVSKQLANEFGLYPKVSINVADKDGAPYLVALGSVADTGDVGVVGRGNRINGLITPMRPMSIEAPAGKNPIDHTGKLYSVVSHKIARKLADCLDTNVEVFVQTSKETLLAEPDNILINTAREISAEERVTIDNLVHSEFLNLGVLSAAVIEPGVLLW